MTIVERLTSPDGLLQLIVDHADDGDWSVGFEGYPWHTHGDVLEWNGYAGTPAERVRAFVDDITASRQVIVISRVNGKVVDVWVSDDPASDEAKYAQSNETLEKRLWNGRPVE